LPKHPAWYHNLKASPVITVELGRQTFTATAEEQEGLTRDKLWSSLVAEFGDLARYAAMARRTIPLFVLRRVSP
jgi:deazaflavin-dependent oxidoreductase (nitroreductase family)